MNYKQIARTIAIILLVILASYLYAQKVARSDNAGPPSPVIKQNAQRSAPGTKEAATGIKATFIELGSVGCTPCDMMRPILDEIEKEYDGQVIVRFWDVKTLFGSTYAEKYKVRVIPMQVFLDKNGNEYYRHEGFFPKEEVIKILKLQGVK